MESLEDVLSHVESLRKDLGAEIVVNRGKGHWENVCLIDNSYGIWVSSYEDQFVIDEPRIAHPDTERREKAKKDLEQVYDSNEWYSARYVAGRALGINPDCKPKKWVSELKLQTKATKQISEGAYVTNPFSATGTSYVWEENWNESIVPDEETREIAKQDLNRLTTELKRVYSDKRTDMTFRANAGRALGYSRLRIWAHEHPLLVAAGWIAAAGVAGGIGYLAYNYLAR